MFNIQTTFFIALTALMLMTWSPSANAYSMAGWSPIESGNNPPTSPGDYSGYGSGGGFSGATSGSASVSAVGSVTSCANVRSSDGNGISGGVAGFQGNTAGSASGGGQSFSYNPSSHNFSYECAGVALSGAVPVDIAWPAFDIDVSDVEDPEEAKQLREDWYSLSTRDPLRGRVGKNTPLFMNEHGICRKIDNTTSSDESLFVDVSTYENWETIHGVPAAGDPNGGFSRMGDRASLPELRVCCSPIQVTICGETMETQYAEVGDSISVFSNNGGFATLNCASNNNFVAANVHGICGSTSGSDPTPSGSGYHNPSTGGTISQSEYSSLSSSVQDSLAESGYSATSEVGTNAVGSADVAQAQASVDAEQAAADAEAAAEAEKAAAEEAAREAAEDDD